MSSESAAGPCDSAASTLERQIERPVRLDLGPRALTRERTVTGFGSRLRCVRAGVPPGPRRKRGDTFGQEYPSDVADADPAAAGGRVASDFVDLEAFGAPTVAANEFGVEAVRFKPLVG